jgi:predicted outer membrane repeat protein
LLLGNVADKSGGGIYVLAGGATESSTGSTGSTGSTLTTAPTTTAVYGVDVVSCVSLGTSEAPVDGGGGMYIGGAYVDRSPVTVGDCQFRANTAKGRGGGVLASYASLNMNSTGTTTTFVHNTAKAGGGLASEGSFVALSNAIFSKNSASDRGGALLINRDPVFFVPRVKVDQSHLHPKLRVAVDPFAFVAVVIEQVTVEGGSAGNKGGSIALTNMPESTLIARQLIIRGAFVPPTCPATKTSEGRSFLYDLVDGRPVLQKMHTMTPSDTAGTASTASTAGTAATAEKEIVATTMQYNDLATRTSTLRRVCNITTSLRARKAAEQEWCRDNPSECYQFTSAAKFGGAIYVSQVQGLRLIDSHTYGSYSPEGGVMYVTSCPNVELVDASLMGGASDFGGAMVLDKGNA